MIFIGALIKLLAGGRVSGAGAALAGFGVVLFGLTTCSKAWAGWPNDRTLRTFRRFSQASTSDGGGGCSARWRWSWSDW
jgi:hypothetical protein